MVNVIEGKYILYAEAPSLEHATLFVTAKYYDGWDVVCMPFPSKFDQIDDGEETTAFMPKVWSVVMHRRQA
jgi:hypothetical protein